MTKPASTRQLGLHLDALEPRVMLTGVTSDAPGIGHPAVLSSTAASHLPDVHRITGVDVAHTAGLDGAGQTVVVIDSGVAYDHPALGGGFGTSYRVVGGWDFSEENDADPYDDGPAGYHGTHVAGIVASQDPQHLGVAPGADIVALRVFNDAGRGKLSWLESSLQWVIENQNSFEHPITTVNLSLGTTWNDLKLPDYAKLEDELQALYQSNIFVTGAAGNRFDSSSANNSHVGLSYPAVSPYVIAAASSNDDGQLSQFSQRHTAALVVPGELLTSTVPDFLNDFNGKTDDFHAASGTSMAAPYLAGVSMLVRQAMEQAGHELITVDAIYDVLAETSDSVFDPVTNQSYQRVNVAQAIESLNVSRDVSRQGDQLFVSGSTADDEIQVDQRGFVRVNGVHYPFEPQDIRQIEIIGNGGNDRLTIDVRHAESHAQFEPQQLKLTNGSSSLQAAGFNRIDVLARTHDVTAAFQGGEQRDRTYITPSHSWMVSGNSVNYVHNTTHVTSQASDSRDMVTIYDSQGDDLAVVNSDSVEFTAGEFTAQANDFASYQLRSTNGGDDRVTLIGTPGDDVVRATPDYVSLRSKSHSVQARGYTTRIVEGGGGRDKATLVDSPGDDQLTLTPTFDTLVTSTTTTELQHFASIDAIANQGYDSVTFIGSAGEEAFVAKPDVSFATFSQAMRWATGFDKTVIDAALGQDSVWLYDGNGDDRFLISPHESLAHGLGFEYVIRNSEFVHAISRYGDDTVILQDHDTTERIFATAESLAFRDDNFTSVLRGFRNIDHLADEGKIAAALVSLGY